MAKACQELPLVDSSHIPPVGCMEGECAQSSSCLNQGPCGARLTLWCLLGVGSRDILRRLAHCFCFSTAVASPDHNFALFIPAVTFCPP